MERTDTCFVPAVVQVLCSEQTILTFSYNSLSSPKRVFFPRCTVKDGEPIAGSRVAHSEMAELRQGLPLMSCSPHRTQASLREEKIRLCLGALETACWFLPWLLLSWGV